MDSAANMTAFFFHTKGVIIILISKKNRQHNGQKTKGQTTIYKTYT